MRFADEMPDEGLFDPVKVDVVAIARDGVVELFIVQDHPWAAPAAQIFTRNIWLY